MRVARFGGYTDDPEHLLRRRHRPVCVGDVDDPGHVIVAGGDVAAVGGLAPVRLGQRRHRREEHRQRRDHPSECHVRFALVAEDGKAVVRRRSDDLVGVRQRNHGLLGVVNGRRHDQVDGVQAVKGRLQTEPEGARRDAVHEQANGVRREQIDLAAGLVRAVLLRLERE